MLDIVAVAGHSSTFPRRRSAPVLRLLAGLTRKHILVHRPAPPLAADVELAKRHAARQVRLTPPLDAGAVVAHVLALHRLRGVVA